MNQKLDIKLSAGSWIYIAGLVGLCGGAVVSAGSAIWSLMEGEWLAAIVTIVVGPVFGLLTFAAYGAVGYLLYNWISHRFPNSRVVSGSFMQLPDTEGTSP